MWGSTLSRPLLIVGLGSRYLSNYLISRTLILCRLRFNLKKMPLKDHMADYSQFPKAIPLHKVDCVRVTHPCATPVRKRAFDLHVLSLPLAFILSQDQTLHSNALCYPYFFLITIALCLYYSVRSLSILTSLKGLASLFLIFLSYLFSPPVNELFLK